jgi:hypothetical protein
MPRYFFHISDGRRTYPDPLGIALPSLEAAKAHARQDAQALSELMGAHGAAGRM